LGDALFADIQGHWAGLDGVAFYTGTVSVPGNATINYPCDASSLLQVRSDGTFSLRDTLSTKVPTPLTPPVKIMKMCIWIGGDYKFGPLPEAFTSKLFKWPATHTSRQWIEGPTVRDQDRPTRMLSNNFDDLECRNAVDGPYVYIKGIGQPRFLPNILDRRSVR
jgi:hypothetical protein